jgi:hypothetical protein
VRRKNLTTTFARPINIWVRCDGMDAVRSTLESNYYRRRNRGSDFSGNGCIVAVTTGGYRGLGSLLSRKLISRLLGLEKPSDQFHDAPNRAEREEYDDKTVDLIFDTFDDAGAKDLRSGRWRMHAPVDAVGDYDHSGESHQFAG